MSVHHSKNIGSNVLQCKYLSHISEEHLSNRLNEMRLSEKLNGSSNSGSSNYKSIKLFNNKVNYSNGDTEHYKYNRVFREMKLLDALGQGEVVCAFLVHDSNEGLQIQEVLSNAVIVVYSFYTHKRITSFAPTPERLAQLFEGVGLFVPDCILDKCKSNLYRGMNNM